MGFFKFLLKLILLSGIALSAVGLYFYDKHTAPQLETESFTVNDVTGLNSFKVAKIVQPLSEQDIVDAINASTGAISIGGARFSMGGQTAYPDSLHLDMRAFNQVVELDPENRLVTVQSGITWRQLQQYIDPYDLSVKVMQDFNNFSVGGSLSVNAHGRFVHEGAIINSVKSFRIVLANGKVYEASKDHNSALFNGAIGGYGGLGVITHVTLELAANIALERKVARLEFHQFIDHFREHILYDDDVVLHNAILYPPSYESLLDVSWRKTEKPLTESARLHEKDSISIWKNIAVDMMSGSNLLKRLRKNLIDPMIYRDDAVVWRNWETSYDLHDFGFISNDDQTLALRVYFVPIEEFEIFTLKMRDIFIRTDADILNISIRYIPQDTSSLLAWARKDVFSFTIIYHLDKTQKSMHKSRDWSTQLIQAAVDLGGSYYMPFQIHESTEQFAQAYPEAGYFFRLKEQADPGNRFINMLWLEHYAKNAQAKEAYYAALQANRSERQPDEPMHVGMFEDPQAPLVQTAQLDSSPQVVNIDGNKIESATTE